MNIFKRLLIDEPKLDVKAKVKPQKIEYSAKYRHLTFDQEFELMKYMVGRAMSEHPIGNIKLEVLRR